MTTHLSYSEWARHWFRKWLVAYSAPGHYLNQCWVIVKCKAFHSWKCMWKSRLRNCGHLVQGELSEAAVDIRVPFDGVEGDICKHSSTVALTFPSTRHSRIRGNGNLWSQYQHNTEQSNYFKYGITPRIGFCTTLAQSEHLAAIAGATS